MFKKVFFKNKKGEKLVGLLEHVGYDKIVVLLHGLGSDKNINGKLEKVGKALTSKDYSVFSFDFAGCGESQGEMIKTTVKSRSQDFKAALKFLRSAGYKNFGIVGASMGAAVAINTWNKSMKVLALIVPLTRPQRIYQRISKPKKLVDFVNEKILEHDHVDTLLDEFKKLSLDGKLERIKAPTLIVQAEQDFLILKKDTRKSYRLLKCEKKFFEVPGTHLLLIPSSFDAVLEEVLDWIVKWF